MKIELTRSEIATLIIACGCASSESCEEETACEYDRVGRKLEDYLEATRDET